VCAAADRLRRATCGDTVTYVVTRNINYTNICYFRCQFCAFSKGKLSENLRGRPYNLDLDEIVRRSEEAWERGATEVCLQGGIHPEYTGATYLGVCRAIKEAVPGMHVHAFSPLEVWQGAKTLGRTLPDFLAELKDAGLGSLPGTAAEILDDEVRAIICPDKVKTGEWLQVMEAAHGVGLRSTVTIMFGSVETLSGQRMSRTSSSSTSAAVPGSEPRPASFSMARKSGMERFIVVAPCQTSSGEKAWTCMPGIASRTARQTSR